MYQWQSEREKLRNGRNTYSNYRVGISTLLCCSWRLIHSYSYRVIYVYRHFDMMMIMLVATVVVMTTTMAMITVLLSLGSTSLLHFSMVFLPGSWHYVCLMMAWLIYIYIYNVVVVVVVIIVVVLLFLQRCWFVNKTYYFYKTDFVLI
jgi:hypothetical protein